MRCADVREWMLEAELAELEHAPPAAFAEHLASCDGCRTAAREILEAESRLATMVASVRPAHKSADVAHWAAGARHPRRWWPVLVPLTAAAALVAVLIGRDGRDMPTFVPTESSSPGLEVDAPPGTSVAVFETGNPKITVVWFY